MIEASLISRSFFSKLRRLPIDSLRMLKPADVMIFSADADRSDLIGGKYYSRIMDAFRESAEAYGYSAVSLAYPLDRRTGGKSFFFQVSFSYRLLVLTIAIRLFRILRGLFRGSLIKSGWSNSAASAAEILTRSLIRRVSPRFVAATDTKPWLVRACESEQVPCVEVLHARGYLEPYESWKTRESHILPHLVVAMDEISSRAFASVTSSIAIGNFPLPVVHRRLLSNGPEWQSLSQFAASYEKVILFTVTWENISFAECPALYLPDSVISLIEAKPMWGFLVRFHPVMMAGRLNHFSETRMQILDKLKSFANVEWEVSSNQPLAAVLELSDCHITLSSFATYDAADAGIRTLVLGYEENFSQRELSEDLFSDLLAANIAIIWDRKTNLSAILAELQKFERSPSLELIDVAGTVLKTLDGSRAL